MISLSSISSKANCVDNKREFPSSWYFPEKGTSKPILSLPSSSEPNKLLLNSMKR